MQVIERLEAHYEVQEVPFGRSYQWCPECIVVECDCGERLVFKLSALTDFWAVCECGVDLTTDIQEKLQEHQPDVRGQMLEDHETTQHPWLHDTGAQADQHLRDEATYPEGSPWRYNDITSRSLEDERDVR
jgi:hypothetical protein